VQRKQSLISSTRVLAARVAGKDVAFDLVNLSAWEDSEKVFIVEKCNTPERFSDDEFCSVSYSDHPLGLV